MPSRRSLVEISADGVRCSLRITTDKHIAAIPIPIAPYPTTFHACTPHAALLAIVKILPARSVVALNLHGDTLALEHDGGVRLAIVGGRRQKMHPGLWELFLIRVSTRSDR